jgi:cytidine deaminase
LITGAVAPVTPPQDMPPEDILLLDTAQKLLARVWVHGRHEVATALRTADGAVYTGVHVEGSCRRSSVCAEGVAMGTSRGGVPPEGPLRIAAIVSVQIKPATQYRIIAPCGVCRELISDYSPDTRVWVTADTGIIAVAASDLLAHKSHRAW